MRLVLALVLLVGVSSAEATEYFISTTGSDAAAGTSAGAPWLTFARAFATGTPKLVPGDILTLLDGTYTTANSGMMTINCTAGANNGTAALPIVVRAQNERQAHVQGPNTTGNYPMRITGCDYWTIRGIVFRLAPSVTPIEQTLIYLTGNTDNIWLDKNLTLRGDPHILIYPAGNTNTLITDHEGYEYDVAMIHLGGSSGAVIRRCYGHDRGLNTAWSGFPASIVIYPQVNSNNIIENCIFESSDSRGTQIQESAAGTTSGTQFLGVISINSRFVSEYRTSGTTSRLPQDTVVRNYVYLHGSQAISHGFRPIAPHDGLYENISLFYAGNQNLSGFHISNGAACEGGAACAPLERRFTLRNANVQSFPSTGLTIDSEAQSFPSWSISYVNAFGNGTNFSPSSHANMSNLTTVNPALGNCRVWIPDASPLSGSGSTAGGSGFGYTKTSGDGASADKGATVLYAYVNGELTTTKLWNGTTGAWLHGGATVTGVNDVAGSSLFDVHERLNVGEANGCPFPTSYLAPPASPFVNGIIDDFDRVDEGPPPSSNWTNLLNSGLAVSGFEAKSTSSTVALHASRWNTSFAAEQEVFADLSSVPAGDGLAMGSLFCRVQDRDNFYRVNLNSIAGVNNDTFVVIKSVAGVLTTLGTISLAADFSIGQQVGLRCTGSTIEAWHNGSLAGSVADSSLTSSGFIGLGVFVQRMEWDGFGGGNLAGADVTPPTDPANCTATAVSSTQIDLVCDASTDAVGVVNYRDEQCDGAACVDFAEIRATSATSYSDTALVASTLYRYRRRAWDGSNFSGYSTIFEATTLSGVDVTAPTAPSALRARRVGKVGTVYTGLVTWTASTDAVGVTVYRIEQGDSACDNFVEIDTVSGSSTSYPLADTPAEAQRCYRVRAGDLAGNLSNYSSNVILYPVSGGRVR